MAGIVHVVASIFYYLAIENAEISRIIPLFNFVPIFTLIIAYFTLGQTLGLSQFIAFFMIVAAGFMLSVKKIKGIIKLDSSFWIMMLSSLLYAVSFVILKVGLTGADFYSGQVFLEIGSFIAAIFIMCYTLISRKAKISDYYFSPKAITLSLFDEIAYLLGGFAFNIAITIVPVALASSFGGLQSFFVFIISLMLSLHFSHILEEKIDKRIIVTKIIALTLMCIGVAMLALL